jgi:hypothetical protein
MMLCGNKSFISFYSTILVVTQFCVESSKLRSWLGPGMFVEGQAPAGRGIAQFLAVHRENIYVFGGSAGAKYLNDLYIYHPPSRTWADVSNHVEGSKPSPRYGHAFIAATEKLFVFGGRSSSGLNFRILHLLVLLCNPAVAIQCPNSSIHSTNWENRTDPLPRHCLRAAQISVFVTRANQLARPSPTQVTLTTSSPWIPRASCGPT